MNRNDAKKLCLVTGASGAFAPALIRRLLAADYRVRALARREDTIWNEFVGDNFSYLLGDITDSAVVENAMRDVQIVFHLAAKLHINNPSSEVFEQYRAVNVHATRNLVEQSFKNNAKFIYASTINVYGVSDGEIVFDETSAPNPHGIYAETKLEAEKDVLQNGGNALRLAAIYGRRMKGNFPKLLQAVAKKRFVYPNDGLNRRSLIFEEDAAEAFVCVAKSSKSSQIFNVTDGKVHHLRDIIEAMAKGSNVSAPSLHIPEKFVQLSAKLLDGAWQAVGRKPFVTDALTKIGEDIAVSGAKIQRETTFRPQISLEEGWRIVASSISNG